MKRTPPKLLDTHDKDLGYIIQHANDRALGKLERPWWKSHYSGKADIREGAAAVSATKAAPQKGSVRWCWMILSICFL